MSASNFPPDVIAAAQASHKLYFPKGPYASVSLAQWAIESAYGHDEPPSSDNPFGIKAVAGQPYVISMTREVIKGISEHIPQHFAKYTSLTDAFDAHAKLLATSPIYAEAQRATSPDDYVRAMAKHYATAPNYAAVILAIMKSQSLYQFDVAIAPPDAARQEYDKVAALDQGEPVIAHSSEYEQRVEGVEPQAPPAAFTTHVCSTTATIGANIVKATPVARLDAVKGQLAQITPTAAHEDWLTRLEADAASFFKSKGGSS